MSATNLVSSEQGLGSIPGVKQLRAGVRSADVPVASRRRRAEPVRGTVAEPGRTPGRRASARAAAHAGPARLGPLARDEALAGKLWEISEEMTGVRYDWEPGAA